MCGSSKQCDMRSNLIHCATQILNKKKQSDTLWVVAKGEVTSDLEHFKKVLPEFRYELGPTVVDNTIGKAMMPTYFPHDNFSGFFTGDFLSTWQEVSHLRISIHDC